MKKVFDFLAREKVIFCVYVILSIIIGVQHYLGGPGSYNNFRIFRAALSHLAAHQNLHIGYPAEYSDLFLYNPSFCIFFAPFSLLPLPAGLILWLVFCALALFYATAQIQEQGVFLVVHSHRTGNVAA